MEMEMDKIDKIKKLNIAIFNNSQQLW